MGRLRRRRPREKIGDGEFPFSPSSVPVIPLSRPRHSLIAPPSFPYLAPVIRISRPRHSHIPLRHSLVPTPSFPRKAGIHMRHVRVKTGIADNVIANPPLTFNSRERVMPARPGLRFSSAKVKTRLKSESGFTGLWDFQDSSGARLSPGRRLFIFDLAGFSVMEKSASRARRNPVNPANPDSGEYAQARLCGRDARAP